jgi:hypothetical protein
MKFARILVFITLVGEICHAQEKGTLPNIISPSPEAASLAKFVEMPVSTFNGIPDISIPLYQVLEGEIKVPIILRYHASGIKVSEDASWVGLGWSLDAGGEIINDQRGENDYAGNGYCHASTLPIGNGDFNNAIVHQYSSSSCDYVNEPGGLVSECNMNPITQDGEPDLYIYNFLNYSGKFLYRREWINNLLNIKAEIMERQKILFVGGNTNISAKTPDGTNYIFSEVEPSYNISLNKQWGTINRTNPYPSSLKLSRITSVTGKKVEFKYIIPSGEVKQTPNISFVKAYLQYDQNERSDAGTYSYNVVNCKYLDSVCFSTGYIVFVKSGRNDLINGMKLDSIKVYQKENGRDNNVKTIVFKYDYFQGDSVYGDFCGHFSGVLPPEYSTDKRKLRLRLLSVKIDDEKPYLFTYNLGPLPYKTSMAVDYWGYFNGVNNNTLLPSGEELCKFYDVPEQFRFWIGANRQPNESKMQAGVLTSITYPTGGVGSFKYSGHRYENFASRKVDVPVTLYAYDYNINNSNHLPDVPCNDTLTFTQSTTVEINIMILASDIFNFGQCYAGLEKWNPNTNQWITDNSLKWDISNYGNECTNTDPNDGCWQETNSIRLVAKAERTLTAGRYRIVAKYPNSDLTTAHRFATASVKTFIKQDAGILMGGGLRVDETTMDPIDGHKLTRKYTYSGGMNYSIPCFTRVVDDYPAANGCFENQCFPMENCIEWSGNYGAIMYSNFLANYSNSANGSIVGYKNVTESYSNPDNGKTEFEYNVTLELVNYPLNSLPGINTSNKLDIGLLINRTDFSFDKATKTYKPVKKISNDYNIFDKMLLWGFKLEYEPVYYSCTDAIKPSACKRCGNYRLHFYPVRLGRVSLVSSTESTFLNNSDTVINKILYGYNTYGFQNKIENKGSDNKTTTTYITYPSDYTSDCCENWIKDMQAKNMVGVPIETMQKVDGNTVNGLYIKYFKQDNCLFPYQFFQLALNTPKNVNLSLLNNCQKMSDLYYKTAEISYFPDGNIKSMANADNYTTVFLWSYNNSLPIAKIENASYGTVETILNGLSSIKSFSEKKLPSQAEIQTFISPLYSDSRLKGAMVTCYTYYPLYGLASICDPNGKLTKFEYYPNGKLKFVKDDAGNIIKYEKYHYQD